MYYFLKYNPYSFEFFSFVKFFLLFNPPIKNFMLPSNLFFYFNFYACSFNYHFFILYTFVFFILFLPLVFNLLAIEPCNFFIYDAFRPITWVMSLEN